MQLPLELQTALDAELASVSSKSLAKVAAELSKRYRMEAPSTGGQLLRSEEDVVAYAAFRLPATFGAVYAALREVAQVLPNWNPRSLADVGAGPGTAMWAAVSVWPDLERITLVERDEAMIALGRRLAAYASAAPVGEAEWVRADLTTLWGGTPEPLEFPGSDLVTASYVLGELPESHRSVCVARLWEMTRGVLVLIEPGTPVGFSRIRKARDELIAAGAIVAAPCPHSAQCPMTGGDWCHFSQRVARSQLHRRLKAGELSYEDEKFSFVAASRIATEVAIPGRILRHPQIRKGHIRIEACTPEGLLTDVVTRSDRKMFKEARDAGWGSVWPPNRP